MNGKCAPLTRTAGQIHTSAMRLNEMLGDGQANATAPCLTRTRFVHAVEAGEDMRQMFRRDANPGILDCSLDMIPLPGSAQDYLATCGSVA